MSRFAVAVLAVLALGACKAETMYVVDAHPVPAGAAPLSLDRIERLIVEAGQTRDWTFERIAEGQLNATQDNGKHVAVVAITFDKTSYSIRPVSTKRLKEEGDTVHPRYNSWVRNLERDIAARLANAGLVATPARE